MIKWQELSLNQTRALIYIGVAGIIIGSGVNASLKVRREERAKRKQILNELGFDVAAIHQATDVVNGRIERGEIRSYDDLRDAVVNEVAFQKMAIREESS